MDASLKTRKAGDPGERTRKGQEPDAGAVIKTVAIIGAGQMGNGIAHVVSLAGYNVAHERPQEGGHRQGALSLIEKQHGAAGLARPDHRGRDAAGPEAHQLCARYWQPSARPTSSSRRPPRTRRSSARSSADLLPKLKKGAMLASNTSSISITRLASDDRPARALHRHALHEPGADDAAGRADPRHRHRGRDVHGCPPLRREPGQDHRGVGGFPGLHRQPHPAADDQRGGLHAL